MGVKCLGFLSANFRKTCVRTLDMGFDAKDYYRYFLERDEKFIIRVKKNRDIIYKNKTCNIMDVAKNIKGITVWFSQTGMVKKYSVK